MSIKPKFRCSTKQALDELAIELNLRERIPCWDSVAGYSYTPSNPKDIEQYLDYYSTLEDEDKKFVLMEMILEANVEQADETEFRKYWESVKPLLIKDYSIHEYTIYYWKDMTAQNFENCKFLSAKFQELINGMK